MNTNPLDDALRQAWDDSTRTANVEDPPALSAIAARVRRRKRVALARRSGVALAAVLGVAVSGAAIANAFEHTQAPGASASPSPTAPSEAATPETPETPALGPVNIALVVTSPPGFYTGSGPEHAEAISIIHVSRDHSRVEIVPVPMRTTMRVPDCAHFDGTVTLGWNADIDVAFYNGLHTGSRDEAAACVMAALEHNTGLSIDGTAIVDFDGFPAVADAVGGATVCLSEPVDAEAFGIAIAAGSQRLGGEELLALVAASRVVAGEDGEPTFDGPRENERAAHEAMVYAALLRELLANGTLDDREDLGGLYDTWADHAHLNGLTIDREAIVAIGYALRDVSPEAIVTVRVDPDVPAMESGVFQSEDWQSDFNAEIVAAWEDEFARILADEPPPAGYQAWPDRQCDSGE